MVYGTGGGVYGIGGNTYGNAPVSSPTPRPITIEVYDDSDPFTLLDIINARYEPTSLQEIGGHGAASFKVSKRDAKVLANPTLIDYRKYIRIRDNGYVVGGCIIQTKKTTIVGSGEEADETWEVSGEGPRSWSRDASVYPSKGLKTSSADTRYFNFATERGIWYHTSEWTTPVNVAKYNSKVSTNYWKTAPAEWPDAPNAYWIWDRNTAAMPLGYVFFRYEFTAASDADYSFFFGVDDSAEVYVDGELLMTADGHQWTNTNRIDMSLLAGPHVLGVKAFNYRADAPGGLIGALFKVGDALVPTAASLVTTTGQSGWVMQAYPASDPGWSIGEVLLTLLTEAKNRGVRFAQNLVPTFTANYDSSGAPWGDNIPWSFSVGASYEDVISSMEDMGCDIWVDPDSLKINCWLKRGYDKSITAPVDPANWTTVRTNLARNPRQVSGGSTVDRKNRWNWVGSYVNISWHPTITTATRYTTNDGVARGLPGQDFGGNADGTTIPTSGDSIAYPVTAGQTVTISSSMYWSWTTGTHFIVVGYYDSSGNRIGSSTNSPTASLGAEATYSGTAPTGAAYVVAGDRFNGSSPATAGVWLETTGIKIELDTTGPYFDGSSSTPGPTSRHIWSGTANASISYEQVLAQVPAIIFTPGHNLVSADATGQAQLANALVLHAVDGWVEKLDTSDSVTKYGRIETQMTTQLTQGGSANLVSELFRQKALPEESATYEVYPVTGMVPYIDYQVGDYVSAPSSIPGEYDSRRIMSISIAEDSKTGLPVYAIEFDTIFADRQTQLEKWLSRISNSSAIGGGFTNSSSLPSTTQTAPPGTTPGVIPDAPTGLVVSSVGYYTDSGESSSDYGLTWNPVISGSGYGDVQVDSYEVWERKSTEASSQLKSVVFDTFAYLQGYRPGDDWAFKVRAISRTGGPGDFCAEVDLVAEAPHVPLPQPSAPELSSTFGTVTVQWDGLLGGNPAPPYVRYVRVDRADDVAGVAGTYNPVGTLLNFAMRDVPGQAGQIFWYRLVAVDVYGNASIASPAASITVQGVNSGDITGGLSSNNLVGNGSFELGLVNWEITSAYPGTSSADVQTGGGIAGAKYLEMIRGTETPGSEVELVVAQSPDTFIPISSVGSYGYFVSAKANSPSPAAGAFSIRVYWWLDDKVTPASNEVDSVVDGKDLDVLAQYFVGQVFPPDDARYMQVAVINNNTNTTINVDDVVAREVITSNMIGDNTITAVHLSAGSVTANAIQTGAITADAIAAGAVDADAIAAGSITTNHLSAEVGASIDISSNASVNILVSRTDQLTGDLSDTADQVDQLTTYYSFGPDGAVIGQTDSSFKLLLKNDRIEIQENGNVVSHWDSGQMIVDSFVGNEVILGNHKLEKFTTGTVVRAIS